jgi:hypothetical protein
MTNKVPTNDKTFVYRPTDSEAYVVQDATVSVKFAQRTMILDEWYLLGSTRWSRTLFRLKHPIVYSKRGLLNLYRRIRRLFIKDKIIQCKRR